MPRVLSEQEFEALKARVLASAPAGLKEDAFNRFIGPAMEQALGEAENLPATPDGSALYRAAAGAWKNLNPVTMATGLYGAVRHPIDTAGAIVQSQLAELQKAGENFRAGRISEGVGHGAAGLIPILGPAAAAAGERIGEGDIAGGVGEGVGLLAPFAVGPAVRAAGAGSAAAVRGARAVPGGSASLDALANMAERASTSRVVDVMAPKLGANKLRFAKKAETIAPKIVRDPELAALSREGLHSKVTAKLEQAEAALDDAQDARLVTQQVETGPILSALDERIGKLAIKPVEASRPIRQVTGEAVREVPVDPTRHYALQWMKDEMENLPFVKRSWSEAPKKSGNAGGGDYNIAPGAGGARIYQAIVGKNSEIASATRSEVLKAINDVMGGKTTGKLQEIVISVADELAGGGKAQKLMETPGPVPMEPPTSYIRRAGVDEAAERPEMVARPLGRTVEPAPNAPELEALRRIRDDVAGLGPVASYEAVRKIRQAWDKVAKVRYNPSMTTDFLKVQGEADGAMKGTGVLRDALAAVDPVTAAANADYSLLRSAQDILEATSQIEQARPTVGRTIMARGVGAVTGAASGGAPGAAIGGILGPLVERIASGSAPTMKLAMARKFAAIADLLRSGKVAEAEAALRSTSRTLPRLVKRTAGPLGAMARPEALPMAAEDHTERPSTIGRR